jgi:hypothetical protein
VYYINKSKFQKCPHVELQVGTLHVVAVVDSGSEVYVLPEELFERLTASGMELLHMSVTSAVLISARSNRNKKSENRP